MSLRFSRSFSLTFVSILNYLRCWHGPKDDHSWQSILTLIIWRLPTDCLSPISSPSHTRHHQLPPRLLSFASFLWLNGLSRHFWRDILLKDIMDLHMLNLGTLVSEEHCSKASSLLRSGTLILYHIHIQRKTHRAYRGNDTPI